MEKTASEVHRKYQSPENISPQNVLDKNEYG
jgi:hypothetical protein